MTRKKRRPAIENISPEFAKQALAALDIPLEHVGNREMRLLYRLHGVEKQPPPDDGDPNEEEKYGDYYFGLWYENIYKTRDRELRDLRRELDFRIWNDPELTDEELSAELRTFYESRITEPD
ncbi:MAG: hypothetical protein AB2806_00970 [Candidatus Thiodiazotropha sp.]